MANEPDVWELLNELRISTDDASSPVQPPGNESAPPLIVTCELCILGEKPGNNVILDESLWVCRTCGSVVSRYLDMTPEWRTFTDSDGRQAQDALRCGAPAHPLLPHSSLGIYIGYSGNEVREMRMVRKLHMWNNLSYRERVLFHVFDTLTVNAANNGIPKTILEQAKVYFYDLSRMQVSRGDNRHGLVASSIYMACKEQGVPRSPKEIARIFNIKPTIMVKSCKKLMDLLRVPSEASTPTDFIQRFGTRIGLSTDMRGVAMHIADQIDKLNIVCPSTPPSIAASIIYMVVLLCNGGLSKKELATKCEISQVTIGKCFGELYPYRMHLLPKETIEKFSIT